MGVEGGFFPEWWMSSSGCAFVDLAKAHINTLMRFVEKHTKWVWEALWNSDITTHTHTVANWKTLQKKHLDDESILAKSSL